MNGEFVGTWHIASDGEDVLEYAPIWKASPQGRPLSLSLPFTPGTPHLRGPEVTAYFENLLPDSRDIRERVARRYRARSTRAFDLLAQVGRDCVGALQILPDGVSPTGVTTVDATPMSEADVAALLRGTVSPPLGSIEGATDGDLRISIAGAQEKTALLYFDGQWHRPHGATPTSHILKLPMGLVGNMKLDLSHSIENEWLCSRILRAYGLPIAECQPLQFEDMKVLSVTRFDRAWLPGPWLARLPQEDFCQATGTPPVLKYEADGGPGIDRIMGVLATSLHPERDRRVFFLAQLIFWMLRAPDGHAKNFSLFIRPSGSYELTPLYDVMSAWPVIGEAPNRISEHKIKLAMAIRSKNAHWKMKDIYRRHWIELGKRHGVIGSAGESLDDLIDALIERTPAVIGEVRGQLPPAFPAHLAETIFGGLGSAARQLEGT
ncbi:MAG: type II toxin-antitoxin system HipA family toxin [Pseudomonas sp.]